MANRCIGVTPPNLNWLKIMNTAIWILGPPAWFFYETWKLFKKYENFEGPQVIQDFRKWQAPAEKFWAGIGIILAAIYKIS